MLTTVRFLPEVSKTEPFELIVTGAYHVFDFGALYATMNDVWCAARKVGEAERDWLTIEGKGWGS